MLVNCNNHFYLRHNKLNLYYNTPKVILYINGKLHIIVFNNKRRMIYIQKVILYNIHHDNTHKGHDVILYNKKRKVK